MDLMRNFQIRRTRLFTDWLDHLRDHTARAIITRRIVRVASGNFGHTRSVGSGVSELKIDFGPGYRVYYTLRSGTIVLLLCGGDKSTQNRDIAKAIETAANLDQEER